MVRSGDLVADRFSQRLSRPYGDVWREAILIDVTPARLAGFYQQADEAESVAFSSRTGRLLGFVAIMFIATILYFVLNAITRGYYRMPVVMIVGALVLLVVIAVVFFLAMVPRESVSETSLSYSAQVEQP